MAERLRKLTTWRNHPTRLLPLIATVALTTLLLLMVAAAKPAGAAFPGENGKMAFVRGAESNSEIYVMNADGSETPTRLTDNLVSASKPDWGPLPDTTPPDITLTTPAAGASYTLGQLVNAEYSCQDEAGGSGLVSCVGPVTNGDPIDTATVSPRTFTVEAADAAGNRASRSHVYSVVYDFEGFFSPVDDPPTFNAVKAGRAIPVKFSLGGDQGLDIFAEGYPRSGKSIPALIAPQASKG